MQQGRTGTFPVERKSSQPDGGNRHGAIQTPDLEQLAQVYLTECELQLQSSQTIATRRVFIKNLQWFLKHKRHTACGLPELRLFFHYLAHGHEEPGGRFGISYLRKPVRPVTIRDYHISLRSFFAWMVAEGKIRETPFQHLPKPRVREDIKSPLSLEQVATLLDAAKTSKFPERDKMIILMLLDTGCRASELVSLRWRDIDLEHGCCNVIGKGNRLRTVFFGSSTAKALTDYRSALFDLREQLEFSNRDIGLGGETPLLLCGRDLKPMKRDGLQQTLERLGRRSGIRASCSPHAFRRTFAVQMLRNGANVFSVQALLGHSDLEMTRRYCAIAQTDVEAQHRRFSPVDSFGDTRIETHDPGHKAQPPFAHPPLTQPHHVAVY